MISVTRKSLNVNNPKLKEVIVNDFANLLDYSDELKGDIYFCCLGTTIKQAGGKENFRKVDFNSIVNFGKIAEKNMAKTFTVISAMGASPTSKIFYNKVKGETECALMELKINRLIIMRPGLLIGERNEIRLAEKATISIFNSLSKILPAAIKNRIATPVEKLTSRMLKEGMNSAPKIKIINAIDI